jgi:polyphosphate kinase 2 (PPK2 family)
MLLVKLWFHVSPEEQLRRFEARQATPHKRWKLTDEDWRNREKWDLYEDAVVDMLQKTSTRTAPWTIVEGNDKYWSRVKTLKTMIDVLEPALDAESQAKPEAPVPSKNNKKKKKKK